MKEHGVNSAAENGLATISYSSLSPFINSINLVSIIVLIIAKEKPAKEFKVLLSALNCIFLMKLSANFRLDVLNCALVSLCISV